MRRIGILTGGGDVPGLNAVIKSVVYQTTDMDLEVIGIRRGWEGLTHLQMGTQFDAEYVRPLDRNNTRGIDRTGGTMLHTSRTNPAKMRRAALPAHLSKEKAEKLRVKEDIYDLTPVVLENIGYLGLEYLIAIGGDDTLSFAKRLDVQGSARDRHSQDHGQRRPGHRILHRLFHGHHAAPRKPSRASAPRSVRMSASEFSASSAATPGSRRCTRPTSLPGAASFPKSNSIWTT